MAEIKDPNLVSVTTINADGSRYFLHPHDVRGPFTYARKVVGTLMIAVYVLLPWIKINGNPALFLDIQNRRFHVFGLTLLPQDLWVLFFCISGLGFALFFVTALLGRLWCGWACPYTVFLDNIYRRIERWFEGDGPARRKLDEAPWTTNKIVRRGLKNTLYLLASAILAHVFISYFVSLERLYSFVQDGPADHLVAFGFIIGLTVILNFCFAWFREQFCVIMCPYGRIQSALTDDDTTIIGYDAARGEPRGKKHDANAGDCVDCHRCVNVCPTGIDIRNGLQMECIGCAACVDACDEIMEKLQRPKGLIRYDSLNGLSGEPKHLLRPRVFLYGVLGLIGLAALGAVLYFKAAPYSATLTRMRGNPWYGDGKNYRNNFQIRMINKRNQPAEFTVSLVNPPQGMEMSPPESSIVPLDPGEELKRPVILSLPADQFKGPLSIQFKITAQPGNTVIIDKAEFLGPAVSAP